MKKILVLGGAGYIGSHVVKKLIKNGFTPVVVDNLILGNKKAVMSDIFYEADIADKIAMKSVFAENDFDAVMHFAAFAYVGESVKNPQKYYKNNVISTINFLDCMLEANVKNIIFSSTCATYGIQKNELLRENDVQNPINPYGRSKLIIEKILDDYDSAYGLKSVCLRYFNAAGADKDGELAEKHNPEPHIIPRILDAALSGKTVKIFGSDYDTPDGTCIRDYVHVDDLAEAHVLALKKLLKEEKSYKINLGTAKGTSVLELIKSAEKVTGKKINVEYHGRREGDPPKLVASYEYAKEILGWSPKFTNIDDILKSAYDVMLNPPF